MHYESPRRGEKDKGAESLLKEIMARESREEMNIQIHEAQEIQNMKNPKQSSSRHIIQLPKVNGKKKILIIARKKDSSCTMMLP